MKKPSWAPIVVLSLTAALLGFLGGWEGREMFPGTDSRGPCRDEIVNVENAHAPASCSHPEHASEFKETYLVCKCRKK
jgi:hypothetical protein